MSGSSTDRDLVLEVVHALERRALPDESERDVSGAACNADLRAQALRRLMDAAEGGPVAPSVGAVIGALAQMDAGQLEQVRRAVEAALVGASAVTDAEERELLFSRAEVYAERVDWENRVTGLSTTPGRLRLLVAHAFRDGWLLRDRARRPGS